MSVLDSYKCEGQISIFDILGQDTSSGRMCLEPSVQTKERTSDVSLKKSQESRIKMPLYLDLRKANGLQVEQLCWSQGGSIAWRVHDAQFWGVPQRRKRISLVADFGGTSAPEILFERKGLSGDSEQSGEERQETSGTVERDSDPSSFTLKIRGGVEIDSKGKRAEKGALIQTELSGTLGVSQDQTLITGCNNQKEVYGICSDNSNSMKSSNPYSGIYKADTTRTLDLNGGNPACNQGGMIALEGNGQRESHKGDGYKESEIMYTLNTVEQHAVFSIDEKMGQTYIGNDVGNTLAQRDYKQPQAVVYSVDQGGGKSSCMIDEEKSPTLTTTHDGAPAVCYGLDRASFNQGKNALYDFSVEEETAQTLIAKGPGGVLAKQ